MESDLIIKLKFLETKKVSKHFGNQMRSKPDGQASKVSFSSHNTSGDHSKTGLIPPCHINGMWSSRKIVLFETIKGC